MRQAGAGGGSTMEALRVIDTDLASGPLTAAVDEVLLSSVIEGGPPTLHLYRRSPPAVTLGYFLKAEEEADLDFCRAHGISVVRRTSGGGAIYTDEGHLVYGLAVRGVLPVAPARCFEVVCGALADGLRGLGCDCRFSPANDILAGDRKFSGSAIVNKGEAKLVHGTVIVALDRDTMFKALRVPEERVRSKGLTSARDRVTSLREAVGTGVSMDEVKAIVRTALCRVLGTDAVDGALTDEEREWADHLVRTRYGTDGWNMRQ